MKIVAKQIFREYRLKHGYSIQSLAKKSGTSYRTIYRLEIGHSAYPNTARKICAALKCTFDDVFKVVK